MYYCSKCGSELQNDMQFCPRCGSPIHTEESEIVSAQGKTHKKKRKGIISVIIIIALIAGAWLLYSENAKIDTYNKFVYLYNIMTDGAEKAETANVLIVDVWRNNIYKTRDDKTDKFTRENDGNGGFYSDFNDALSSLYSDQSFKDDLEEIYTLQAEAGSLIKDLAKHPRSFDEEYSDFKDCYQMFVKFTNMSLTGNGSLKSFTDEHNELDNGLVDKLTELNIYFS